MIELDLVSCQLASGRLRDVLDEALLVRTRRIDRWSLGLLRG